MIKIAVSVLLMTMMAMVVGMMVEPMLTSGLVMVIVNHESGADVDADGRLVVMMLSVVVTAVKMIEMQTTILEPCRIFSLVIRRLCSTVPKEQT